MTAWRILLRGQPIGLALQRPTREDMFHALAVAYPEVPQLHIPRLIDHCTTRQEELSQRWLLLLKIGGVLVGVASVLRWWLG